MHKTAIATYAYKEKRRRYNKANNPEYARIK